MSHNEVGGFGITESNDLLFVKDIVLVKQTVSMVTVSFDDNGVADFFADQVEAGRKPEQFARIWVHTHPGSSPTPSCTDEDTFLRVFGSCDWAIMAIVAEEGRSYARLRFNTGPGGDIEIPICVDYGCEFDGADYKKWKSEYRKHVKEDKRFSEPSRQLPEFEAFGHDQTHELSLLSPNDLMEQLEHMHPGERQQFMEELAVSSEFWDEDEMGVFYE